MIITLAVGVGGIYFWGGGDNLHCAIDTEEPVELEISFHIFVYQFRANNLFIFRRGIINHGNEGMFFSYHVVSTMLTHLINPLFTFAYNFNIRRSHHSLDKALPQL